MARSLIPVVEELSPATLTVLAQTISPNDQGMLKWDMFFPREDVSSVDLDEITTLDFRPVSDRREWNQRGRQIVPKTPELRNLSIVPVEAYRKWGEYEMQKIREQAMGANADVLERIIGNQIRPTVRRLTEANYRRVEVDAMTAWSQGIVTAKNPQTGETQQVSFSFDADRMSTAGTAWDNSGISAYDELTDWLEDAIDAVGPIEGIVLRLPVLRAIQADAPDLLGGVSMTRAQLAQRVSDDLGYPFEFFLFEDTLDIYNDGGTETTRTKVWPVGRVAAVPAGGRVGRTAFAPVVRAMDLVDSMPGSGIDTNGMTVYYEEENVGRDLTLEVQCNPLTVPDENRLYVRDTGISS
jgi:hypothetical protein